MIALGSIAREIYCTLTGIGVEILCLRRAAADFCFVQAEQSSHLATHFRHFPFEIGRFSCSAPCPPCFRPQLLSPHARILSSVAPNLLRIVASTPVFRSNSLPLRQFLLFQLQFMPPSTAPPSFPYISLSLLLLSLLSFTRDLIPLSQ